jgi:4-hydroxyphenylpyruvate dioxygenase
MRRSIATVSMSGTLPEKLKAIAAARFDGYELFENDLVYSTDSPATVGRMSADLGLTCELYQPFRDFEGSTPAVHRRNLERAERKFDVMEALGARLMLVCSNCSPDVIADEDLAAAQLHELAERAGRRNLRIGFEALAWGRATHRYGQAWSIVKRADHPHLGLILDSMHTLSLRDDPSAIVDIPGDKIFFLQMADSPLLVMDVLQWARHYRNFPGQGQFDLPNFLELVLRAGYTGPLSLEIFNDVFRETPNRRTATDAMRSLLYLEGQVRERLEGHAARDGDNRATKVLDRIELLDPPATPVFSGIAFLEFAVDDASGSALATLIRSLGFTRAGRHRTKNVTLYRQGRINLVLNGDRNSPAARQFEEYGPSVCAIGLATDDPVRAVNRATALQSARFDSATAKDEARIPAIVAPGGIVIYFVDAQMVPDRLFATDFVMEDEPGDKGGQLQSVDHLALGLALDRLDTWVLFCRSVLGLTPGASLELADPFGLIRTAGVANAQRNVRLVLNVSLSQRTRTARTVNAIGSVGVHHIAFDCDDIFATVERMRSHGVEFVAISPNYYDDLTAKLDLAADVILRMRGMGILYDQSPEGAYFHIYSATFADRFFFEVVQRSGKYDAYGALNAPARMASQAQTAAEV